jgi:hypothetical protein
VRGTSPAISWAYGLVYDESALSNAGRAFACQSGPSGGQAFGLCDLQESPRGG